MERRGGSEPKSVSIIRRHHDLDVYQKAFALAMRVFNLTKQFPRDEMFGLTSQIRRSSRSVCSNVAEAWRKRRYPAAFVAKLGDAEAEAAETQTWIEFAVACGYWDEATGRELSESYDKVLGKLVRMIQRPQDWTLRDLTSSRPIPLR